MIEALAAIAGAPMTPTTANSLPAQGPEGVFGQLMERTLMSADQNMVNAENALQQLASGQPVEIHDVMIALETARISVQTLVQVRNRMVDAYQELMRMQI